MAVMERKSDKGTIVDMDLSSTHEASGVQVMSPINSKSMVWRSRSICVRMGGVTTLEAKGCPWSNEDKSTFKSVRSGNGPELHDKHHSTAKGKHSHGCISSRTNKD
jgi:hypothetical protein